MTYAAHHLESVWQRFRTWLAASTDASGLSPLGTASPLPKTTYILRRLSTYIVSLLILIYIQGGWVGKNIKPPHHDQGSLRPHNCSQFLLRSQSCSCTIACSPLVLCCGCSQKFSFLDFQTEDLRFGFPTLFSPRLRLTAVLLRETTGGVPGLQQGSRLWSRGSS